jgi:glycerophosphoryl diester phosphodiesterase
VFAHRGLAIEAPENTLLAFARALAAGVTHIETDVHASADGVAIISHDPDLERLVGRKVSVAQLTSFELRRIDLGYDQTYSTLAEALDGFPDVRFNIDIKVAAAVDPTVEAILEAGATDRVLIGSFGARRRLAAVRRLRGVATSVSARGAVAAVAAARAGAIPALRRVLRDVHAVQLPTSILGINPFSSRAIASFHEVGIEVHAWTINEPGEMDRLLEAGVDGLISDRADLALDAVERFQTARKRL